MESRVPGVPRIYPNPGQDGHRRTVTFVLRETQKLAAAEVEQSSIHIKEHCLEQVYQIATFDETLCKGPGIFESPYIESSLS
jgi:hypothetical protein